MLLGEQISYLDAILGNDNVHVEVVDGSVEIKVPQGCQPETVLRIRGKGAPQLNNASVSVAKFPVQTIEVAVCWFAFNLLCLASFLVAFTFRACVCLAVLFIREVCRVIECPSAG